MLLQELHSVPEEFLHPALAALVVALAFLESVDGLDFLEEQGVEFLLVSEALEQVEHEEGLG